jgi:hypothetical protein
MTRMSALEAKAISTSFDEAFKGLSARHKTDTIYALGPVPRGSPYFHLLSEVRGGVPEVASHPLGLSVAAPVVDPPGPVVDPLGPVVDPLGPVAVGSNSGLLFTRDDRSVINDMDGLTALQHRRAKTTARRRLDKTDGCIFNKHGLISRTGLMKLEVHLLAHLEEREKRKPI